MAARSVAPPADPLSALRVKDKQAANDRADWASQKNVWIPDDREGFVAARVKSEADGQVVVVKEDTKSEVTLTKSDVQLMNPPKFNKSEDMAALTNLNEASVLFNIKDRYLADLIYTFSGLFCVVVNPYKQLPIYSEDVVREYKGRKRDTLPPHVYAIADEAYRNMVQDNEDQSILCTGESGAGKTENTKKVIQYLATVASSGRGKQKEAGRHTSMALIAHNEALLGKGELEERLLQANPILETFGNAATTKNDNSSRFGKFIRIIFDNSGYIVGANIDVYLLEKSRSVRQNEGERNFHGFYQLLRGASKEYISQLLLDAPSSYRFLTAGDRKLPNVDDAREFAATNNALTIMGLTEAEILSVWRVVSAVLMFGQMDFDQEKRTDQAVLKSDQPAQKLCHLLGINVADFIRGLLRPKLDVGGGGRGAEQVVKQQTRDQVQFSVEALAKAMYERLFLWLVQKINTTLGSHSRDGKTFIGLLDIAGFEIFKTNSFEQLCINFTNEKLQQLFNHKMFVLEQDEYMKEKIDWKFIDFGLDLQPTIDLIEQGPDAVLPILNDQSVFPKATDQTLLDLYAAKLKDRPKFEKTRPEKKQEGDFIIRHYAGPVPYSVKDWLVKNKDPLNNNITALLEKSSEPFIEKLWRSDISSLVPTGGVMGRGVMRTVAHIYKEQLANLMMTLGATNPHFVRCIIPNHQKRAGFIDSPLVLDQLRCNGVLEGIRICRQGFPNRILFQEFRQRYKLLCPTAVPAGFVEGRKACELMVAALALDPSQYRLGESKIFFRAGALHELEERRDLTLSKLMLNLQAHCRGFLVRRAIKRISPDAVKVIQRNIRTFLRIRSWAWWRLYTKVRPLVSTVKQDQQLRDLQAEVERLRKQVEADAVTKRELEESNQALQQERRVLTERLKQAEDAALEAQTLIQRLSTQKSDLDEDIKKVEAELEEQITQCHELVKEKKELVVQVAQLQEAVKTSDAVQARINQLTEEVKQWRSKHDGAAVQIEAFTKKTATQQKDLQALQEQLDAATLSRTKSERTRQALQNELGDVQVQLANEKQTSAALQAKQKGFDKSMSEVKVLLEQSQRDLEHTQTELRETQTRILVLKNELADMEQRATSAETSKRKLEEELENMIQSAQDLNVQQLERVRRELQTQVEDQKKQIIELEDELQLANDARMRSEVSIATMNKELQHLRSSAADSITVEALESKVRGLQRQVAELQEEADTERRQRGKLSNDNRKLVLDMTSLQDQLEEEKKQLEREKRLRENAEARLRELTAGEAGGVLNASDARELERLRLRNKQYKAEFEEIEVQLASANGGKRRAERELEEQRELIGTYEKEIAELRAQLRRIMSSLQSGEHGPVSIKWTVTEHVTSRSNVHGESKSSSHSHSESGTGVPPSLDKP